MTSGCDCGLAGGMSESILKGTSCLRRLGVYKSWLQFSSKTERKQRYQCESGHQVNGSRVEVGYQRWRNRDPRTTVRHTKFPDQYFTDVVTAGLTTVVDPLLVMVVSTVELQAI